MQVVTTFELPGCEDMWTVIGTVNNEDQVKPEAEGTHAFLILSHEDSSMVLYVNYNSFELSCKLIINN